MIEVTTLKWLVDKLLQLRGEASKSTAAQWEVLAEHADRTAEVIERAVRQCETDEPVTPSIHEAQLLADALSNLETTEATKSEIFKALRKSTLAAVEMMESEQLLRIPPTLDLEVSLMGAQARHLTMRKMSPAAQEELRILVEYLGSNLRLTLVEKCQGSNVNLTLNLLFGIGLQTL